MSLPFTVVYKFHIRANIKNYLSKIHSVVTFLSIQTKLYLGKLMSDVAKFDLIFQETCHNKVHVSHKNCRCK